MAVEFVDRATGWRPRGRPRTPADPKVVEQVQRTYRSGTMARLTLPEGTTADDVRAAMTGLRRAAEQLGLRLRLQPRRAADILAARELRFYAEGDDQ